MAKIVYYNKKFQDIGLHIFAGVGSLVGITVFTYHAGMLMLVDLSKYLPLLSPYVLFFWLMWGSYIGMIYRPLRYSKSVVIYEGYVEIEGKNYNWRDIVEIKEYRYSRQFFEIKFKNNDGNIDSAVLKNERTRKKQFFCWDESEIVKRIKEIHSRNRKLKMRKEKMPKIVSYNKKVQSPVESFTSFFVVYLVMVTGIIFNTIKRELGEGAIHILLIFLLLLVLINFIIWWMYVPPKHSKNMAIYEGYIEIEGKNYNWQDIVEIKQRLMRPFFEIRFKDNGNTNSAVLNNEYTLKDIRNFFGGETALVKRIKEIHSQNRKLI